MTGTATFNGVNLSTTALITDWSGLLTPPPHDGDVIEYDWSAGADWDPGETEAFSIDVPLLMRSQNMDTAIGDAQAIQALVDGQQHTLTRTYTPHGVTVTQSVPAVMTGAAMVTDFGARQVRLVCILQLLAAWA